MFDSEDALSRTKDVGEKLEMLASAAVLSSVFRHSGIDPSFIVPAFQHASSQIGAYITPHMLQSLHGVRQVSEQVAGQLAPHENLTHIKNEAIAHGTELGRDIIGAGRNLSHSTALRGMTHKLQAVNRAAGPNDEEGYISNTLDEEPNTEGLLSRIFKSIQSTTPYIIAQAAAMAAEDEARKDFRDATFHHRIALEEADGSMGIDIKTGVDLEQGMCLDDTSPEKAEPGEEKETLGRHMLEGALGRTPKYAMGRWSHVAASIVPRVITRGIRR